METATKPMAPWTTASEKDVITYLASDDMDGSSVWPKRSAKPTLEQRKAKLRVWLARSYERRWDKGVNPDECRKYASYLYDALEQMQEEVSHD